MAFPIFLVALFQSPLVTAIVELGFLSRRTGHEDRPADNRDSFLCSRVPSRAQASRASRVAGPSSLVPCASGFREPAAGLTPMP